MFGKKKKSGGSRSAGEEIQGFLGDGTYLQGDLTLEGGFRVDGKIQGSVRSDDFLVVGAGGEIVGKEIRAAVLTVSGLVKGSLDISERLDILPGGRVHGEVRLGKRALRVEPGGVFEGTVTMPDGKDALEDRAEPTLGLVEEAASA